MAAGPASHRRLLGLLPKDSRSSDRRTQVELVHRGGLMAAHSTTWRYGAHENNPNGDSLVGFLGPRFWPAWCLVAWLRVASLLPWRFAIRLHKGIGTVLWLLLPRRRHVVARNLELAFPELGRKEIRLLTRRHFQSLTACVAETAFAWFGMVDDSLMDVELDGVEHVYAALTSGSGVILYTGHFTPLEICAPILKRSFPLVGFMFRRRRNALLDAVQRRGRQHSAHISFPSDNARAMIRALKRKAVVWYAPDQSYSSKGSVALPHFGQLANVSLATSRIARMGGARVIPFAYYRKPDDSGYVLRFDPAVDQAGTDEECTRRLLTTLEGLIAENPDQYAWTPNRLRNTA